MKIAVFGLGYVGTVSAACLAEAGHCVIGVDINQTKVDALRAGTAPIIEAAVDELVKRGLASGHLDATTDASAAIKESDMSWVCVGTPSQVNGSLDTGALERVCTDIGEGIGETEGYHTVVIRSTALPGTTEDLLIPIIETASGSRVGKGFGLCYHPEFMREGSAVEDFNEPPKVVVGEPAPGCGAALRELYEDIGQETVTVPVRVAEMIKYADNAWHALKVVFANEIGRVSKRLSVDSRIVMDVFCQDSKLNISERYLRPGFAFGGSCLPKDVRALTYRARQLDVDVPVLEAALVSNDAHVKHGQDLVTAAGNRRVGIVGLSFKAGTDDLRESPLVRLAEYLLGKGYDVTVFDRLVQLASLTGANRDYVRNHIPHIERLIVPRLEDLLERSDTIVLADSGAEAAAVLRSLDGGKTLIDLTTSGFMPASDQDYRGVCW